jgi:hypothetical protein
MREIRVREWVRLSGLSPPQLHTQASAVSAVCVFVNDFPTLMHYTDGDWFLGGERKPRVAKEPRVGEPLYMIIAPAP